MCAVHSRHSLTCSTKKTFRTSATFGRGIASIGLDVPLRFQTIKGGINSADGHFAMSAEFDFLPHGHSVCAIFQSQQRQKNDVLEFSEVVAAGHYLYIIDQIIN